MRKLFLSLLLLPGLSLGAKDYKNPVIDRSVPDPTVLRVDGTYYLYGTEDTHNLPIFKSDNLVDWTFVGTAFTDETRPKMVPGGALWAPDIQKIGDKYVLYYSKSKWGGEWECGIGVATSDSPEGPFTDQGKLFISKEINVQNSIDPVLYTENGKHYLFWGSFHGIYGIEMTDDGLALAPGAKPRQISGSLTEGTNILKRGDYYYLVGSAGSCCEGEKSTYRVMVARSKDLFGPYLDREGRPAMDNYLTEMMVRSDKVVGPGHNANFVKDDAGNDWMVYHGFDAAAPEKGRKVYLDRIVWDKEGWPTVDKGMPSAKAKMPVIKKK
ncbi:MAG: family 43 glycosylhydrolase [Muribaculaceae bacterium]|nr:family 43 glycosylhydrolase [Muribaculaceae bacterium]